VATTSLVLLQVLQTGTCNLAGLARGGDVRGPGDRLLQSTNCTPRVLQARGHDLSTLHVQYMLHDCTDPPAVYTTGNTNRRGATGWRPEGLGVSDPIAIRDWGYFDISYFDDLTNDAFVI
jgi:hypothetical protein